MPWARRRASALAGPPSRRPIRRLEVGPRRKIRPYCLCPFIHRQSGLRVRLFNAHFGQTLKIIRFLYMIVNMPSHSAVQATAYSSDPLTGTTQEANHL